MRQHVQAGAEGDSSTRERVVGSILEHGPSTAVALAGRLGLTPAAIRRHLDLLVTAGAVEPVPERNVAGRGRGRPARAFALTGAGRDDLHHAYDDLAIDVLEYLSETGGSAAVKAFAERRTADLERRCQELVAGVEGSEQRAAALAGALSEAGFVASRRPARAGEQICQHHCPVAHVAERFPELCEAETEAFARVLGVHVQRLATIAHGDGVCTTHVPDPEQLPSRGRGGARTETDVPDRPSTSEREVRA